MKQKKSDLRWMTTTATTAAAACSRYVYYELTEQFKTIFVCESRMPPILPCPHDLNLNILISDRKGSSYGHGQRPY